MASWHTHNRRARRKRERDARLMRDVNKLLVPALGAIVHDALLAAFTEMVDRMKEVVTAWVSAGREGWLPLDPKYAGPRPRREQWPEVVYEDILDAEFIE